MSFERENDIELGINALLHPGDYFADKGQIGVFPHQHSQDTEGDLEKFELLCQIREANGDVDGSNGLLAIRPHKLSQYDHAEEGREARGLRPKAKPVVVNGSDIGDLPTEYVVTGLGYNELPVIGTYVAKKILAGFRYRVRELARNRQLFKGKPMVLQRIGMGYGKRITFEGESKNYNSNYFYSDTQDGGYGFSLVALKEGDCFVVSDQAGFAMGEGVVGEVSMQKELSTTVMEDGSILKHVAVAFTCGVQYGGAKHGLLPLFSRETLCVTGVAAVVKAPRAARAVTRAVEHVELPCFGPSVLTFTSE